MREFEMPKKIWKVIYISNKQERSEMEPWITSNFTRRKEVVASLSNSMCCI